MWPVLQEEVVPFAEFVSCDLVGAGDRVAYLAQHALFEQLPVLATDYTVPPLVEAAIGAEVKETNAWSVCGPTECFLCLSCLSVCLCLSVCVSLSVCVCDYV